MAFVFDKQGHNLLGARIVVDQKDAFDAADYLIDNLPYEVEVSVPMRDGSTQLVTLEFFPHNILVSDMEPDE